MESEVMPEVSIVMPVYNEEDCIGEVIEQVKSDILTKLPSTEMLVVDDGSTDKTPEIVQRAAKEYSQIIHIRKDNGGHGDALLHGMRHAKGKYIFLMDSDGQTVPEDFWYLWRKRKECDFITGVRFKRDDPLHRLMISRLLRYSIRIIFGVSCQDANVPFKLMSINFWKKIERFFPNNTLTPSLLLSVAAKGCLGNVIEIDIRHLPRKTGTCTIRYFKLLRFCVVAFWQLMAFRVSSWPHVRRNGSEPLC